MYCFVYSVKNILIRDRDSIGLKVMDEVKKIVEEVMQLDNETMSSQLLVIPAQQGFSSRRSTILRCRSQVGWTFHGDIYCQHIREANKVI